MPQFDETMLSAWMLRAIQADEFVSKMAQTMDMSEDNDRQLIAPYVVRCCRRKTNEDACSSSR